MIISYRYVKWCELCLVWMNWKLVKNQYDKFMNKSVSDQMEPLCFQYSVDKSCMTLLTAMFHLRTWKFLPQSVNIVFFFSFSPCCFSVSGNVFCVSI